MTDITHKIAWDRFVKISSAIDDPRELDELFCFFFTPEERDMLSTRILLITELLRGEKPQRQISKDVKISIAKITRGSNELKRSSASLKKLLRDKLID
jgi:TrpR family transcriptional regulator, trp operon repressor